MSTPYPLLEQTPNIPVLRVQSSPGRWDKGVRNPASRLRTASLPPTCAQSAVQEVPPLSPYAAQGREGEGPCPEYTQLLRKHTHKKITIS